LSVEEPRCPTALRKNRAKAYEIFPILGERVKQQAGLLSGGSSGCELAGAGGRGGVRPDSRRWPRPSPARSWMRSAGCRTWDRRSCWWKAHEVLEVADTVAFMELGRLVWMGPSDQLDEERLAGTYLGMAT
jgi:hypothetical protein